MNCTRVSLRAARIKKSLTQKRLAELTGVTETTIRNIENGRSCPSFKLSIMLAKLLNVDFETLWEYDFRNS
ncbi:helix-turn-helix transcriptional regulator [Enterococcus faecalis]|uniref:helix-turn-helix transcriptional regulator n=1 Tax=Enterococcus faecalis TaxID=1351 RepID=UPI001E5978E9|nr:helix-turn-helix transcriptional regulator [Enterococcus faecalis]